MDTRRLQYIVTLAEHENFGRAAKALHIAQPALSQHVKAIEREFMVTLFNRTPQGTTLTDEGKFILPKIKAFLEHSRQLKHDFKNIASQAQGELRVAYNRSLPNISKFFFDSFANDNPLVVVNVVDVTWSERMYHMVLDDEVDVGIVKLPLGEEWQGVHTQWIGSSVIMVALPEGHDLASNEQVTGRQLANERIIAWKPSTSPAYYNKLVEHLGGRKLDPIEAKEPDAIYALMQVKQGNGVFLIDEDRADALQMPGIVFRPLDNGQLTVDYGIIWKSQTFKSLALRRFERYLK